MCLTFRRKVRKQELERGEILQARFPSCLPRAAQRITQEHRVGSKCRDLVQIHYFLPRLPVRLVMGRSEFSFPRILAQSLPWHFITLLLKSLLCFCEAELWKMAPAQSDSGLLGQLVRISPAISQLQMRDRVKAWYRQVQFSHLRLDVGGRRSRGEKELRTIPDSQWLSLSCSASKETLVDEQQDLSMLFP